MANGHGGSRDGSGRKSKAEEMGLPKLVEDIIGEEGKKALIGKIYEKALTGSFPHQQMLMFYMFGKPQDHVDLTTGGEKINSTLQEVVFKNYGGDSGEGKAGV